MSIIIENECLLCESCVDCGLKRAEYIFCDECGDQINGVDELAENNGDDYHCCMDCYKLIHGYDGSFTLQSVLGADEEENNRAEADIYSFFAYMYTSEDINEILINAFEQLPKYKQHDYLKDYAEQIYTPKQWIELSEKTTEPKGA